MTAAAAVPVPAGNSAGGKIITREYIQDFFALSGAGMDKTLLDFIMANLVPLEFIHNKYICREGEAADAMYFIEAGAINVRNRDGELINELGPGRYFGEYAVITGDSRNADVQANGRVKVFKLEKKVLLTLVRSHPSVYGIFLKNVYKESSQKYRKLINTLNQRRGVAVNTAVQPRKGSRLSLFVNYYLVGLLFLNIFLMAPNPAVTPLHPLLLCSPLVFLVVYILATRRALEALVLSCLYTFLLMSKQHVVSVFYEHIISSISDTASIILIIVLMGILSRLLSASGSINALKEFAAGKLKTGSGTLVTAFLATIPLAIDEYLCVLINGSCFKPLADQKRISRERSSMVMGMTPFAICMLNPVSLTGIYLTGVMAMSAGGGNTNLFIGALTHNYGAMIMLAVVLLLALRKIPAIGPYKKAAARVAEGGQLWPPDSDDNSGDESDIRGKLVNLLLPVAILMVSSVAAGTIGTGRFSVDVLFGMVVTLIATFLLYVFQQYMTPDQFFRHVLFGVESMLGPVIMFVIGKCFASGMEEIGFSAWLSSAVQNVIGGQAWLLPAIVFGVCTLVGGLFDNPWAMYAIGVPLALQLSAAVGRGPDLYLGAVCAAGLLGNEFALGDIFFVGPMLGINAMAYYRSKLPYVILITVLAFACYLVTGRLAG